jgi:hypothetical protein
MYECALMPIMHDHFCPPTLHTETGCGGIGAPAVGAGGFWERPTRPLGDALPFGRRGLAHGQRPRISGGTFFMQIRSAVLTCSPAGARARPGRVRAEAAGGPGAVPRRGGQQERAAARRPLPGRAAALMTK